MESEKQLYQWDTNQSLVELTPSAQFVDYPIGDEVIRIKADGTRCRIPDEVLQTYGGKTCYERYPDGTFRAYSFSVLYAPKPPDYVYTPEERTTFEALTARVDAAIEEIKRRADSGEFTPVKGVDYFTEAEKNELMESVSTGAIGEFRKVVDSAITEYNDNHNLKLAKYNANASEKLTTYDVNAEQQTTDYNRNAAEKLEAYNQNHAAKVAEYNQNAAALQTEVDRLRGECDTLAAENRNQENRISALMKLNKGQTYDILPEEGEAASRTAPSGAKYVSVDKVGGKSLVWNQKVDTTKAELITKAGVTVSKKENGKLFLSGTATGGTAWCITGEASLVSGHKYISARMGENIPLRIENTGGFPAMQYEGDLEVKILTEEAKSYVYAPIREGVTVNAEIAPFLIDLTLMFGVGNEPTAEQFNAMFPEESYPYNPGEIISNTTAAVELEGKNLWDDSNPAFMQVLLNAGFVYNSGVWHTNNSAFSSVNIGTIPQQSVLSYDILADAGLNPRIELFSGETRILSRNFESTGKWIHHNLNIPSGTVIDRIVVDYAARGMCKIKNIQLERGTTETAYSPHTKQSLSTGFPELNSAGTAHDVIDLDGGAIRRNVGKVDLGSLSWSYSDKYEWWESNSMIGKIVAPAGASLAANAICNRFEIVKQNDNYIKPGVSVWTSGKISVKSDEIKSAEDLSGVTLYFEKATPTTEQVTIPNPLQEWLPVEAGGTVTFKNADESKQLAVPNGVSWVRKLDEVE